MKRAYESGAKKRSEKKRSTEVALSNTRDISQYLLTTHSTETTDESAPTPVPTEEIMQQDNQQSAKQSPVIEENDQPSCSSKCTETSESEPQSSEQRSSTSNEQDSQDLVSLFDTTYQYPTDRGKFPDTITDANVIKCILAHGPCRPKWEPGNDGANLLCEKHYYFYSTGNLKITREWLCYSPSLNKPYCETCWLFADRRSSTLQWQWINGISCSNKSFAVKVKRHEKSDVHLLAMAVYQRWKAGKRLDREAEKQLKNECNFWRQILCRIINIILTLSVLCLAFRGHCEYVRDGHCEGWNLLALVAMQAKFDPLLQQVLEMPWKATKYLSATIQNEIIMLISTHLRRKLVSQIKTAPFYSIIVDTTSDITREDKVSVVIRWLHIDNENKSLSVDETFLGFLTITDSTAFGLTDAVSNWLINQGLDLQRICGQGYDGASIMSGIKGGMQKMIQDIVHNVPVPYIHCASHNLNLIINDAVECNVNCITFFGTVREIFSFFGSSLNRWAELAFTAEKANSLKLKKLCPTRWTSRIDAIRAVKNRFITKWRNPDLVLSCPSRAKLHPCFARVGINQFLHSRNLNFQKTIQIMDICLILVTLVIFLIAYYFRPRDPTIPPGPRPLPIIGNLLQFLLSRNKILPALTEGKEKYGNIMTSYLGPYMVVTLRGYKNIYEAFVTKADTFSGRAKFLPGMQDYLQGKGIISEDGESWRKMRRFTLRCLRDLGFGKRLIEDKIIEECRFLNHEVENLNTTPSKRPITVLNKATSNVMCSLVYGNRFEYTDPEFVQILDKLRVLTRGSGKFPLEWVFPIIKYIRKILPIEQKLSPVEDFVDYARSFTKKRIEEHKKTFDGDNVRDFVDMYLKVQSEEQDNRVDEEDMFATIIDLFMAGSETSSNTLDWALLYMVEYPDVQRKCQEEIDREVGNNREVRWSDRTSLPYVEATMHEVQRCATIAPIGVAHCTTEDTEFQGYRIPAKTMIMADLYSALNDPDYWENPEQFSPDRFLDGDGKLRNVEAMIPFSIGPRVCLGESLAKMELFLFFGNMLQQFTFSASAPVDWNTETFSLNIRGAPFYQLIVNKRE